MLDGASRRHQFWRITIPLLNPTIIYVLITSTIGALQIFVIPKLMTAGRSQLFHLHAADVDLRYRILRQSVRIRLRPRRDLVCPDRNHRHHPVPRDPAG